MRTGRWLALLIFASAVAWWGVGADLSAQEKGSQIAIVEMNRILAEATALRSIQVQGEEQRRIYQAEAQAEAQRLRNVRDELQRQEAVLTPAALEESRRAFDNELRAADQKAQERSRILRFAVRKGEDAFRVALQSVVAEVAVERGIDAVVPVNTSLYAVPELNLTDEVIARINEEIPEIALSFEGD